MRHVLLALLVLVLSACASPYGFEQTPHALGTTPVDTHAVYEWTATKNDGRSSFRCSATLIELDLLATARHCVVEIAQDPVVKAWGAFMPVIAAWASDRADAGLIRVEQALPGPVMRLSPDLPEPYSFGWVSGYGCDPEHVRVGEAMYLGTSQHGLGYLARSCPGDSGGGLFLEDGRQVGIMVTHTDEAVFATPIADLLPGLTSDEGWVRF